MPERKKSNGPHNHTLALVVLMGVFFICGFSTVLNDVLIPYLQKKLQLTYASVILIQSSFYLAYFLFSPLTGFLFRNSGYLKGIRWGLSFGAFGTLLISSASTSLSFDLILVGVFILGGGIAMVQVSANPYALQLGNESSATSRLSLTQSFTSVGTILSPYVGSTYILSTLHTNPGGLESGIVESPLKKPYIALGLVWLALLGFTFLIRRTKDKDESSQETLIQKKGPHPLRDFMVLIGMLGIAICVGVEVAVGSFLISFLTDANVANIPMETAGKYTMLFWLGFLMGRVIGSWIMRYVPPGKLLFFHAFGGLACTICATFSSGFIATASVLALGLCTSIMFPVIFGLVLSSCKGRKSEVSGFLCMANIGGAVIPFCQGALADVIGIQHSFIIPVTCFIFLTFYAQYMSKKLNESAKLGIYAGGFGNV
ncbi:MAG: FHS family L-fucose permease-like MFS transporter [Chlamydiales bacterium]|jgi:FHS family L-fucose permease-like MFS transporter